MIELNKEEKNEVLELSKEFIRIHGEILSVEESIKRLEQRSEELISELEECRAQERAFSKQLSEKYGQGSLDPTGLCWKKDEILNYAKSE